MKDFIKAKDRVPEKDSDNKTKYKKVGELKWHYEQKNPKQ
jgi:hypothetical protein